ncbi:MULTISPECIES: hypothetical protein [Sphingobacterium]|uniref:hypothetical protein n=1 Tax=Sphingobacterium TaxID=28453 RepID=UPI00257D5448|nr:MULTISPECIES: hypothetical protein [Sphingobacterium]
MRDLKKIVLAVCIALSTLVAMSCSKDDETVVEPQYWPVHPGKQQTQRIIKEKV